MKVRIIRKLAKLTLIAIAYSAVFQTFYNWMRYKTPYPYESVEELLFSTGTNFVPIWILIIYTGVVVTQIPSNSRTWIKIARDILLSAGGLILLNLLFHLVTNFDVDWGGTAFNATFILLGFETFFYTRRYNESIRKEAAAREENLKYRYEVLKAQVNPHFLFNSLNILSSLTVLDVEKSRSFIISLSRMYRHIMLQENKDIVEVGREIEFLENYIDVLKIRYANQLDVKMIVHTDISEKKLVPYTLQLLMENVTKHNIISSRNPMNVTIEITESGIRFSNPVHPKKETTTSGFGTNYLVQLYDLHGKTFKAEQKGGIYVVEVPYIA